MRICVFLGILCALQGILWGADDALTSLGISTQDPNHPELVTIRLKNRSNHDIYWLDWWMPGDEKVRNRLLEIKTPDGQEAEYIGIFASYGEPKRRDYVLLKAGATVETTVDLTKSYRLRQDTDYDAVIDLALEYYNSTDAAEPGKWALLKSNRLKLRLESTFWQRIRRWWTKNV